MALCHTDSHVTDDFVLKLTETCACHYGCDFSEGLPREIKIDEEYPGGDDGGFRRSELPPIADVEPFTDTDSRLE